MFSEITFPTLSRGLSGAILVPVGLILLFMGWRLYRVVLVAAGVLAAGLGAAWLAQGQGRWVMMAASVAAGLAGGGLAFRFERYGVFLMGGAASAAALLAHEAYFTNSHSLYFAALSGFLLGGSLAVVFWRPAVVFMLCAAGAVFVERGAVLLLASLDPALAQTVTRAHQLALCLGLLLMILMGVAFQFREDAPAPQAEPETQPPPKP